MVLSTLPSIPISQGRQKLRSPGYRVKWHCFTLPSPSQLFNLLTQGLPVVKITFIVCNDVSAYVITISGSYNSLFKEVWDEPASVCWSVFCMGCVCEKGSWRVDVLWKRHHVWYVKILSQVPFVITKFMSCKGWDNGITMNM